MPSTPASAPSLGTTPIAFWRARLHPRWTAIACGGCPSASTAPRWIRPQANSSAAMTSRRSAQPTARPNRRSRRSTVSRSPPTARNCTLWPRHARFCTTRCAPWWARSSSLARASGARAIWARRSKCGIAGRAARSRPHAGSTSCAWTTPDRQNEPETAGSCRSRRAPDSNGGERSAESPWGDDLVPLSSDGLQPLGALKHGEHPNKVVAALEDEAGGRHDAVGALSPRQPRMLLDAVKGYFAGVAEGTEHCLVAPEIDGVVAPFAGGDLAAVEIEDGAQLSARKENGRGNRWMCESAAAIDARAAAARAELYRLGFAQRRLPGWLRAHDPRFALQFQARSPPVWGATRAKPPNTLEIPSLRRRAPARERTRGFP